MRLSLGTGRRQRAHKTSRWFSTTGNQTARGGAGSKVCGDRVRGGLRGGKAWPPGKELLGARQGGGHAGLWCKARARGWVQAGVGMQSTQPWAPPRQDGGALLGTGRGARWQGALLSGGDPGAQGRRGPPHRELVERPASGPGSFSANPARLL